MFAKVVPEGSGLTVPYRRACVSSRLKEVGITLCIALCGAFVGSCSAELASNLIDRGRPVALIAPSRVAALAVRLNTLTCSASVRRFGIVVDDAIRGVESGAAPDRLGAPVARREQGAIAMSGGPVIAIACSVAAVFVPVAFLGGLTGSRYGSSR